MKLKTHHILTLYSQHYTLILNINVILNSNEPLTFLILIILLFYKCS